MDMNTRNAIFERLHNETVDRLCGADANYPISEESEVSFIDKNWSKGKSWMNDDYVRIVSGTPNMVKGLDVIQEMIRRDGRIVTEIKDKKLTDGSENVQPDVEK